MGGMAFEARRARVFSKDAHALLMSVYKDESQPIALRLQATKVAIGYEKPRLAAINANVEGGLDLEKLVRLSHEIEDKTESNERAIDSLATLD